MMTVNLYKCSDDIRVVNKTLSDALVVTAIPYDNCSITAPILRLSTYTDISEYNYFQIVDWGRYYFIRDVVTISGGAVLLMGDIDVLKTYASQIPELTGCIIRSESIGKPTEVVDNSLPINPNVKNTIAIDLGESIFKNDPAYPYFLTIQGT